MKSSSLALIGALLALGALTGCETAEDRQIAAGQACLDSARDAASADQCISIVQGLESESSYLIRCSANFVANGFTGNRIASAFQRLKDDNGSGGQDPMMTMMTFLVFQNTSDNHKIATTINNCQRSGVTSMFRLATTAQLATTIASLGGALGSGALDPNNPSFDPTQLQTIANNLISGGTTQDKEQIGSIAITAAEAYCNEGSSYKGTEVCTNLEGAIATGGGNLETIGQTLLSQLQANQ